MKRVGSWTMGAVALTASAAVQANSELGTVLGRPMLSEEPQSGVLAVVGVGLLVLSAFAKRRRDP